MSDLLREAAEVIHWLDVKHYDHSKKVVERLVARVKELEQTAASEDEVERLAEWLRTYFVKRHIYHASHSDLAKDLLAAGLTFGQDDAARQEVINKLQNNVHEMTSAEIDTEMEKLKAPLPKGQTIPDTPRPSGESWVQHVADLSSPCGPADAPRQEPAATEQDIRDALENTGGLSELDFEARFDGRGKCRPIPPATEPEPETLGRNFRFGEEYGPFPCKICNQDGWTIRLSREENAMLPQESGPNAARYILEKQLGVVLCDRHLIEQIEPEPEMPDDEYDRFSAWFDAEAIRFHHAQYSDKQIAYAGYLHGKAEAIAAWSAKPKWRWETVQDAWDEKMTAWYYSSNSDFLKKIYRWGFNAARERRSNDA